MVEVGNYNGITDIEGLLVGHYTDKKAASGVSVVLCLQGATAAVDVRGAAPGTRETDLLDPSNLVQQAQAIVLTGGSVFGLAAADGVARWLAENGYGFPLGQEQVAPIVPAAVLFDLGRGAEYVPPVSAEWGRRACLDAKGGSVKMGNIGAATGALAGGVKGGLGTASYILDNGLGVAALVAVNSLGSVLNPDNGRLWEIGLQESGEFGPQAERAVKLPPSPIPSPATNTTIGVVATDALLSKAQARKVAQMAHDGLARAIRPSHTMFDGDTVFCLATGKNTLPKTAGVFAVPDAQTLSELGHAAAGCLARSIMAGVLNAESAYGMQAFRDLEDC